jgi:hypothetical protein
MYRAVDVIFTCPYYHSYYYYYYYYYCYYYYHHHHHQLDTVVDRHDDMIMACHYLEATNVRNGFTNPTTYDNDDDDNNDYNDYNDYNN